MLRLTHADVLNDINTSVQMNADLQYKRIKSPTTSSPHKDTDKATAAVEAESVYTQGEQRGGA